jgi:hypothetical protein
LYWKLVGKLAQVMTRMRTTPHVFWTPSLGFGLALLALAACKPAAGSSCDAGEARCLDSKRAIACDDGKFVETPCKGKAGCSTVQETTTCDIAGNEPGDVCVKSDEGVAVCTGADAMLACHERKFEQVPCRGARGCELVGGQASCDQSVAEPGEACKKPGAKACSVDKSRVLSCDEGGMREQYLCRGEAGCAASGGKLSCDQTVAKLGDACDKGLDGHVACSDDKKSMLTCNGDEFIASEKCKPGTVCTVSGQSTSCAKPER